MAKHYSNFTLNVRFYLCNINAKIKPKFPFIGSLADREHRKWEEKAISLSNNPYCKENIARRRTWSLATLPPLRYSLVYRSLTEHLEGPEVLNQDLRQTFLQISTGGRDRAEW